MSVPVAVRIRPLNASERLRRCNSAITAISPDSLRAGKGKQFRFDHVFGPEATQAEVYDTCVKPMISSSFEGYNVTVMAYGQTGTGKTYTMGQGGMDSDSQGVMQFAASQIFDHAESMGQGNVKVLVSYVEIYMESVVDLLDPTRLGLQIRESKNGSTALIGVSETEVHSAEEFMRCLAVGTAARQVNSTAANSRSSRSHAILSVMLEINCLRDADKAGPAVSSPSKTYSQLQFVDLAGSERSTNTHSRGTRMKEAIYINSGLLALGNVVSALSTKKRRQGHVPYRDSKLTRLLKSSIGGNSKTIMILCVGPSDEALNESLCTLKYGTRARSIKNDPKINYDPHDDEIKRMRDEIARLQTDLLSQQQRPSQPSTEAKQDIVEMSECIAPVMSGLSEFLPPIALNRLNDILQRHGIQLQSSDAKSISPMDDAAEHQDKEVLQSWQKSTSFGPASRLSSRPSTATANTRSQPSTSQLEVRAENLQAEVKRLREQLDHAQACLREDEVVFAKKNNEIEILVRDISSLRAESTGSAATSHSAAIDRATPATPWRSPFTLGQRTWSSPTSATPEVGASLTDMMDKLRLQTAAATTNDDIVCFGESLDETMIEGVASMSLPSKDVAPVSSPSPISPAQAWGGATPTNHNSTYSTSGSWTKFAELLDAEVDARLDNANAAKEQQKINDLEVQRWELGVQRDSVQLQQLRRSQLGGIGKGLVDDDSLDHQLEHIHDEITSMDETIEYRADLLRQSMGRTKNKVSALSDAVDKTVHHMQPSELRTALIALTNQVITLRVKEDALYTNIEEKDALAEGLRQKIAQMEQSIGATTLTNTDKLRSLTKENARLKLQLTATPKNVNTEHLESRIAELNKSLYYYKKRCRELRRMLEACSKSGVVVTDQSGPFRGSSPSESHGSPESEGLVKEMQKNGISESEGLVKEMKKNEISEGTALELLSKSAKNRRGTFTVEAEILPSQKGRRRRGTYDVRSSPDEAGAQQGALNTATLEDITDAENDGEEVFT